MGAPAETRRKVAGGEKVVEKQTKPLKASSGRRNDGESDSEDEKKPSGNICQVAFRKALRDMLNIADYFIECGARSFHIIMKILGPCLVCLAVGLKGFVTYTFFTFVLPTLEEQGVLLQGSLSFLGLFLLANAEYNYFKSIFTNAGTPPDFEKGKIELAKLQDDQELGAKRQARQCGKCSLLKPPRAHHCSVCGRCVMKMDHHCPWVNNCVGHGNYRYFCLFLLFLGMSCTFIVVVFSYTQWDVIFYFRRRALTRQARQYIMTSFMICCSILVALSCLGGFHVYLVLTNQTTIEFQINMVKRRECRKNGEYYRNPYDLGRTRNFQEVFGPNKFCSWTWLLSWLAVGPSGDGLDFASISRLNC